MPEFVIERDIPGASQMSEEQMRAASLKALEALKRLGPEIRWIRSFVTDDKIFCIYFAPNESMIREHGRLAGIPVDRVTAVRRILDPEAFQA
jgi:hypothetical protein